ncbi:MAG: DUF1836 domain-containing protein [Anaerovorax sp.]
MSHKNKEESNSPVENREVEKQEDHTNAVRDLQKDLLEKRPIQWDQMPDIDLYMDQVLEYMVRQHIGLEGKESLTSAMVNNYIKRGLLPRAHGKKYDREHIAYLTAICLFKQILSVDDTDAMLKVQLKNHKIDEFYNQYCHILHEEFNKMADKLAKNRSGQGEEDMKEEEACKLILELAISSYVQKSTCEKLLRRFSQE